MARRVYGWWAGAWNQVLVSSRALEAGSCYNVYPLFACNFYKQISTFMHFMCATFEGDGGGGRGAGSVRYLESIAFFFLRFLDLCLFSWGRAKGRTSVVYSRRSSRGRDVKCTKPALVLRCVPWYCAIPGVHASRSFMFIQSALLGLVSPLLRCRVEDGRGGVELFGYTEARLPYTGKWLQACAEGGYLVYRITRVVI